MAAVLVDDEEVLSADAEKTPLFEKEDVNKEYTVDEAVNHMQFGLYHLKILAIAGFCWTADAMEIIILSFLSPAAGCEWQLSIIQEAGLVTVVFLGMMLGAASWGKFSDYFGRRKGYLASSSWTLTMGLLSAAAPSYVWLLFLRCMTGFGVGGSHVSFTIFSEFVPSANRTLVMLLSIFFALGACLEVFLAWAILPHYGWRWLLVASACPLALVCLLYFVLPETPRFLVVSGRRKEAEQLLHEVARVNGTQMLKGKLSDKVSHERGAVSQLLHSGSHLRATTLVLWTVWFTCSFTYYGTVQLITQVTSSHLLDDRCGRPYPPKDEGQPLHPHALSDCSLLFSNENFMHVLFNAAWEIPGVLLAIFALVHIGRRANLFSFLTCAACCFGFLFFCTGKLAENMALGLVRAFVSGAMQTAWVYTIEVYPTTFRSTGLGICSSMARVGGMLSPVNAQLIAHEHVDAAIAVFGTFCLISALLALTLHVETRGQGMLEHIEHVNNLMKVKTEPDAILCWDAPRKADSKNAPDTLTPAPTPDQTPRVDGTAEAGHGELIDPDYAVEARLQGKKDT